MPLVQTHATTRISFDQMMVRISCDKIKVLIEHLHMSRSLWDYFDHCTINLVVEKKIRAHFLPPTDSVTMVILVLIARFVKKSTDNILQSTWKRAPE